MPDDGKDGRLHRLCHPWDQGALRIAGPLGNVLLEDLEQRFVAVVKVRRRLASPRSKLFTHVLDPLNHALGQHRRESETPSSLLRAIKLWYILPALPHSHDGRLK